MSAGPSAGGACNVKVGEEQLWSQPYGVARQTQMTLIRPPHPASYLTRPPPHYKAAFESDNAKANSNITASRPKIKTEPEADGDDEEDSDWEEVDTQTSVSETGVRTDLLEAGKTNLLHSSAQRDAVKMEPEPEGIDIQIRNVVTSFSVGCHVDLRKLTTCHVNYERSKGLVMKQLRRPHCFVKLWSSGKASIVGCRSEEQALTASRRFARLVQRQFPKAKLCNYRVTNIMATCRLPFGIRIEKVNEAHPVETQYEPELTTGLIWRSRTPKATLRIHTTGSVTVTGATSCASVLAVLEVVYPILEQFQCPPDQCPSSAGPRGSGNKSRGMKRVKREFDEFLDEGDESEDEDEDYDSDGDVF